MNGQLSEKVCSLLKESLGIAPDRVYLNFSDIPAGNWGWNGEIFRLTFDSQRPKQFGKICKQLIDREWRGE